MPPNLRKSKAQKESMYSTVDHRLIRTRQCYLVTDLGKQLGYARCWGCQYCYFFGWLDGLEELEYICTSNESKCFASEVYV